MSAKKKTSGSKASGFSAEERAAMRERAKELKAQKSKADGERDVRAKLAKMPPADRAMGERLFELIADNAPQLTPKTWYGMPAWSNEEGQTVCFFQSAAMFKARYATLGFSDKAKLDDGNMWPTSFALKALSRADEARVVALVKLAVH